MLTSGFSAIVSDTIFYSNRIALIHNENVLWFQQGESL